MPLLGLLLRSVIGFFGYFSKFLTGFWSQLSIFILWLAPSVVGTVIKLLGIGLISYVGFDLVISNLSDFLFEGFNSLPIDLLQILKLMRVDTGLNILFAAMSVSISIKLFFSSTKMVWRKSQSN